jgi:hypothetical protein
MPTTEFDNPVLDDTFTFLHRADERGFDLHQMAAGRRPSMSDGIDLLLLSAEGHTNGL